MDDIPTPREAFERWLKRRGTPLCREGDGYRHPYAQDCWEAYQVGHQHGRAGRSPINSELASLAIAVVENCEALCPGCADEGIGGESPDTLKSRLHALIKM